MESDSANRDVSPGTAELPTTTRATIASGFGLLYKIIIAQLVVAVLAIAASLLSSPWESPDPAWLVVISQPVFVSLEVLAFVAWRRLLVDPGAGAYPVERGRIRICVTIRLIATVIGSAIQVGTSFGAPVVLSTFVSAPVGLISSIAFLCLYFFSMDYFARIARLWCSDALGDRIDAQVWKLILWATLGALILVGPFVALLRYLRMLEQLRLAAMESTEADPRLISR